MMLFFLTGDIQSGKTRWLQRLVDDLAACGVTCAGVIAPGIWKAAPACDDTTKGERDSNPATTYEKLGIENVLLPQGERFVFGMRRKPDAAQDGSQSTRAGLGWDIPDASIERVNAHFDRLRQGVRDKTGTTEKTQGVRAETPPALSPRLLVVDELGVLELLRGEGLVSAVRMLDEGPSVCYPCALACVRRSLLDVAQGRFDGVWPDCRAIFPDEDGRAAVLRSLEPYTGTLRL